ncbi:hypothetical protein ScPMuIL_011994 [Solemya velum]
MNVDVKALQKRILEKLSGVRLTNDESLSENKRIAEGRKQTLLDLKKQKHEELEKHLEELHKQINVAGAKIKDHLGKVMQNEIDDLVKFNGEMEREMKKNESLCSEAVELLASKDYEYVVRRGQELCDQLDASLKADLKPPPEEGPAFSASFIPGKTDPDMIEGICGKIDVMSKKEPAPQTTPAPREEKLAPKTIGAMSKKEPVPTTTLAPREEKLAPKTLPVQSPSPASGAAQKVVGGLRRTTSVSVPGDGYVWWGGLCVVDDDTAWVGGEGVVTQVRVTGGQTVRVCKTVRVCDGESRSYLTRTDDGMYVSSNGERKVYRVSEDGQLSLLSSLTFRPVGLTPLSPGCVLVCGGSKGLYEVTGRGAQRVDLGGSVESPCDVAVNSDGDIAVVDFDGGRVCIFTREYKLVHTYSPTDMSAPFRPSGVTCDGDNLVISDWHGAIHVLDRRGVCLVVHRTAGDCVEGPGCVAMSPSGRLWAMFWGGTVCIYDMV